MIYQWFILICQWLTNDLPMITQANTQATRICLLFGLRSRDEEGLGLFWADWKTIILDLKKRKNFALETTLKKIYDSRTEKLKKAKKKDSKNAHKINRDGGKTKKMREGSERRIGRKREMREREREREERDRWPSALERNWDNSAERLHCKQKALYEYGTIL